MVRKNYFVLAMLAMAVISLTGRAYSEEKKHEHEHKSPHGGALLEVGAEVAHLELVHDEKAGKVTLYVLDGEAKNAVPIKDAPKLNIKSKDGNKQIETKSVDAKDGMASKFEATDDALKADPLQGRIVVSIKDKKYNVDIKEDRDHDHK